MSEPIDVAAALRELQSVPTDVRSRGIWDLLCELGTSAESRISVSRTTSYISFVPKGCSGPVVRCAKSTLTRFCPDKCPETIRKFVFGSNGGSGHGNGNRRPECHDRRSRGYRSR